MQPKGPLPPKTEYKPTPLPIALKQKPKESKIIFKGLGSTGIRFQMPKRTIGFEDKLSFFAVGLAIAFFIFIFTQLVKIWPIWGTVSSIFASLAIIAFILYEALQFNEQQALEIHPTHLRIYKHSALGTKDLIIPLEQIIRMQVATSSPTISYLNQETGKVDEAIFMDYCSRREKEWMVMTLRSIIFYKTGKTV